MIRVPDWYHRDVSRETLDKLNAYVELLVKWTAKINLISKTSKEDIEQRHIWDSAQIYTPTVGKWLDLGSGGGLPGVVTAILAQGDGCNLETSLMESDQRKAVFLRTCARELSVPINVVAERIEDAPATKANILSARALSDLNSLIGLSARHLEKNGLCLFMKGANWREEVQKAEENWRFTYDAISSQTHPQAVILKVKEIERV